MKKLMMTLLLAALTNMSFAGGKSKLDIVDTAVEAGVFQTLATALTAADLVTTLKSEGPFTVFAPTDDAFAKLPAGTIDALLADIPALTNILIYHVATGKLSTRDLLMDRSVPTINGQDLKVSVRDGRLFINDSKVIQKVKASNGVIYVIDSVLLPQ